MHLNRDEYRKKVLGCWMGKNIGGTLGAPFEWRRKINDVSFYTQDLAGEPLPNDDLDIQLLWLVALEEQGVDIDAHVLAEYWLTYVTPHWCEYGTGKINMRAGLMPPLCGTANNPYKHSCGAFIRSEIWACIAPGCPRLAARYAYEDAILDHGNGEGTYAEVLCAAMESAAFVESDLRKLIDIGLTYIPGDCAVRRAVDTAREAYDGGKTWQEARNLVLDRHRGGTMMGFLWCTSEEDQARGFHEGEMGYDVPSNIALLIVGLLYGEGDFAESLCIAVNCGEDTDCTAATAGALFGIIHGADGIPQKWIDPIGRGIKTACLNLGELGYFGNQLPQDVDGLTDRTERLAHQVLARHGGHVTIGPDAPTDLAGCTAEQLYAGDYREQLLGRMNATVFRYPFFEVAVDYGEDGPAVRDGEAKPVALTITNHYKIAATFKVHWYAPEGWTVSPAADGVVHVKQGPWTNHATVVFTVCADRVTQPMTRMAVELTMDGRPQVILVPVALQNGNLART